MNEVAKAKLADFLDKEVGNKEIVIADLIEKVYEFAIGVERKRCIKYIDFGRSLFRPETTYGIAVDIVCRAMVYNGDCYNKTEFEKQVEKERQYLLAHERELKESGQPSNLR
jgi:hypothetical protein